tara:strand:+ start:2228 stop:2590 length:363 start_codon:yes stop_codon:yes gene_type:complete
MDGAIDLRLILTLGGILFSVAGAAAVGKMQIKVILENLADMEKRLRDMDKRVDTLEAQGGTQKQRIDILAQMSSPENLRREHMQMSELLTSVERLKTDCDRLYKMHNGKHPPVSDIRTAE